MTPSLFPPPPPVFPGRYHHPSGVLVSVSPVLPQHGNLRVRTPEGDRIAQVGDVLVGWPSGSGDVPVVDATETALWRRWEPRRFGIGRGEIGAGRAGSGRRMER